MLTDQNAPTALTDSADADPNLTLQMQQKAAAPAADGVIPPPPPLTNSAAIQGVAGSPAPSMGGGLAALAAHAGTVHSIAPSMGGALTNLAAATAKPTTSAFPAPSPLTSTLTPTGGANDAGTATHFPSPTALPSSAATPGGAAPAPYTAADTALDSTILPNADPRLTAVRGLVDNAAGGVANVDRVKLAKDAYNTFKSETDPAYAATIQDATRAGAAGGQVGSGQLRTRYGDLALQRSRDLQNEQDNLIQNATQGSIQDSFQKLGALSGLEGQSYGEGAADRGELRQERSNKLGTGLSLLNAGSAGNPADYYAQMAKQLGMDPSALQQLTKAYSSQS